ncbi:MAG: AAA family ATPase [Sphingobium sp.]
MTGILGHDAQRIELMEAAAGPRMHHGWILSGPKGIGKATLARAMARSLLAGESEDIADDHPVARLVAAQSHPDFVDLTRLEKDTGDLARNITVDQVRGLHRLLESAPSLSQRRIILIDSADDLERGGANALLKNLEEPPKSTIFLLVSHSPSRLLPTIRSRCRMLRFSSLDDAQMRQAIAIKQPNIAAVELDHLMTMGEGSPGRALGFVGLGIDQMTAALDRIALSGDLDNAERLALSKQLAARSAKLRFEAFLDAVPAFLARQARHRQRMALGTAIGAWEQARQLASAAIPLSLDPATVIFELCGLVAVLAEGESATA